MHDGIYRWVNDYRLHSTFGDALSDITIWQRGRGGQDRLNNLAWWIDLTAGSGVMVPSRGNGETRRDQIANNEVTSGTVV